MSGEDRYRATLPVPAGQRTEAGRAHLAEQLAERAERGRPFGLGEREVAAADAGGLGLREYAGLRHVRTVEDYDRLRAQILAAKRAENQARHEVAIEAAKKAAA